MKLKYELLLEEKGLNLSDLPADAQRIITNIKKIKGGIALNEGKGKKPSDKNIADLNLQDKLAVREINEYLAEKNKPDPAAEEAKKKAAEEAAEADKKKKAEEEEERNKKEAGGKKEEEAKADPKGIAIDLELQTLLKNNKETVTLAELKQFAPNSYGVIFDTYDSGPNGITTSNYQIMETEKEIFKISKTS